MNDTLSSLKSQLADANDVINQTNSPNVYVTILNWTNRLDLGRIDVYVMAFNAGKVTAGWIHVRFTVYVSPHAIDENVIDAQGYWPSDDAKSFVTFFNAIFYSGEINVTHVTVILVGPEGA